MYAVAVRVELRIPAAGSLKDRRRVLHGVRAALRRFEISVAEVGVADRVRYATLGLALVSGSHHELERTLQAVERRLWSEPEIEVLEFATSWLEED